MVCHIYKLLSYPYRIILHCLIMKFQCRFKFSFCLFPVFCKHGANFYIQQAHHKNQTKDTIDDEEDEPEGIILCDVYNLILCDKKTVLI